MKSANQTRMDPVDRWARAGSDAPGAALPISLLGLAFTLAGCLPWGDASDWERAPADVVSWDWIEVGGLEDPPAIDYFGLNPDVVSADYVGRLVDLGVEPFCTVNVARVGDDEADWTEFLARSDAAAAAGVGSFLSIAEHAGGQSAYLDPRRYAEYLDLIVARFARCADMGFVRVALSNLSDDPEQMVSLPLDGLVPPTLDDARTYYSALLDALDGLGLGAIQVGATGLAADLEPRMDALLLEGCLSKLSRCGDSEDIQPYVAVGKPVLRVEYSDGLYSYHGGQPGVAYLCSPDGINGLSVIVKSMQRDARTIVCAARPADRPCDPMYDNRGTCRPPEGRAL